MATDIFDCYDDELDGFTDELAGDFDFLSSSEREGWLAAQWMTIAEAGGWRGAFERTLDRLRQSQLGLASLETAALGAFSSFIRQEREEPGHSDRALSRATVLTALQEAAPGRLWRVATDVGGLPSRACYARATWTPAPPSAQESTLAGQSGKAAPSKGAQVTIVPRRTFLSDAGPSYFWDAAPPTTVANRGCGWSTPLRLSLGTFPWVYGHRLQAPAPGLMWRSNSTTAPGLLWRSNSTTAHPAPIALGIAASFWQPEGNLRADAREVLAAWKHWRETTGPLVASLPSRSRRTTTTGEIYRVGERLVAHQTGNTRVGINGPRGHVCVPAYNFIQERFAAFFSMRRALLRGRRHLSPELRDLLRTNPDPCVRQQLGIAALSIA